MKRSLAVFALGAAAVVHAQPSATDAIARYREMIADGNPADLWDARGEALWKQPRGPKNASLERCDLGQGPGVVKGAFVQLPRWFADTQRVQDLESRLLTCMQALQGLDPKAIADTPFGRGERANVEALVAYIVTASRGLKVNLPQSHPKEREFYEIGKRVFYFRGGPYDFSCASCHQEPGKRIRLQDLPDLTKNPGDGIGFAAWPAYRVSAGEFWTMQWRLWDCYRQQRFPAPTYASDATIALGVYLGVNAKGAESIAPSIKR